MSNPLLDFDGLPAFAEVRPEHVGPAVQELVAAAEAALERAVGPEVAADYAALSAVLDVAVERLHRSWGAVTHLQEVADTPALRAAYAEALPRITALHTKLGADARLYAKYKAVAANARRLDPEQRKALADRLRDFALDGAELEGAARERFAAIRARRAELSQRFGENVLDATDRFALYVETAELDGVEADLLASTAAAATADGHGGHKLTVQHALYRPLMQQATNRPLRERLYRAMYQTQASEFGSPELDNTALMRELVELRQEEAALLGYPNWAAVALVPKMAESPEQVLGFVRDLARRARPQAEVDRAELEAFAASELGIAELREWDRPFASERLQRARFSFSSEELRRWFPLPHVLQGLFDLVQTLFQITIRPVEAALWHDSARWYEVERDGRPIAAFTLDLVARAGKQSGAWMDDARQRWRRPDAQGLQLPVAHLACNFAPGVGGSPSLLTHDDLVTLFHEFGHALHQMLTRVDELAVSGLSGVEWDAVEMPSQFMENFCWQWEVLSRLSSHVDDGSALPREIFERLLAARHFQSALRLLRQCELDLFDMRLHLEPGAAARVAEIALEVNREIAVWPAPPWRRWPNTLTHVFDGGYDAGMYGYAWAEVLSADAFSAFEETGLFDAATGRRWRESVLEVGGSRPAIESFVAFRGRAPRIEALLRHQGIA